MGRSSPQARAPALILPAWQRLRSFPVLACLLLLPPLCLQVCGCFHAPLVPPVLRNSGRGGGGLRADHGVHKRTLTGRVHRGRGLASRAPCAAGTHCVVDLATHAPSAVAAACGSAYGM